MDKSKLKKDFQKIIDICDDGVKGYETASKNIEHADLKTLFLRLSQQRKGFIEDIKNEALKAGIELDASGTIKGFFHRTWLATKSTFSSDTNEKVIEEALFGEKEAVDVYDEVLRDPEVPAFLVEKLREQQDLIKVSIQQLNGLKSEFEN